MRQTVNLPLLLLLLLVVTVGSNDSDDANATANKNAVSTTAVPAFKPCLVNGPEVHQKRFMYYRGKSIEVVIEVSNRVTHRLITELFRIYINETLGYQNIRVVEIDDTMNTTERLKALAGDYWLGRSSVPSAMINLEVWVTTDYDLKQTYYYHNVYDYGVVAPPGRFSWIVPKRLRIDSSIFDKRLETVSYKVFERPETAQYFRIDDVEDLDLIAKYARSNCAKYDSMMIAQNTIGGSDSGECGSRSGIYKPEQCQAADSKCALLLSGDFASTSFLIKQIEHDRLYVEIAWLDSHLQTVLNTLMDRFAKRDRPNRSLVVMSTNPSDMEVRPGDYYHVQLATCDYNTLDNFTIEYGCRYDLIQLRKIGWKILREAAEPIHDTLNEFTFDYNTYGDLLSDFRADFARTNNADESVRNVACQWVRDNPDLLYSRHNKRTPLFIGGIFPLTGVYYDARILLRSAQLAIDAIVANRTILPHHDLKLMFQNGECQSGAVLFSFLNFMQQDVFKNLLGVLGPACSDTAAPLASVAKQFNTMIVSYSAEGARFSNRDKYPFFFRTIGENTHYSWVYFEFFRAMGWNRVASFSEDGKKYTEYISLMNDVSEKWNVQFVANKKFLFESDTLIIERALNDLKKKRARIIIADLEENAARLVMCKAYYLNMTARNGYVWFLPLWFTTKWYNTTHYNKAYNETVNCTDSEMMMAINGYFTLSHAFFGHDSAIMQENITVKEWKENVLNMTDGGSLMNYAGYVYDAIWLYALAAHRLLAQDPEIIFRLHHLTTARKLVKIIETIDFNGVSGRIRFNGGPSRFSDMNIHQFMNGSYTLVGTYYPNVSETLPEIIGGRLELKRKQIVWLFENGTIPDDGAEPPVKCFFNGIATYLDVTCDTALLIINAVIFLVLAAILSTAIYLVKRRYKEIEDRQKYFSSLGLENLAVESIFELLKEIELPEQTVVVNRTLGHGSFGIVYGGELQDAERGNIPVAVKTLKPGATVLEKIHFLFEAEIMRKLNHTNVLKLIGVVTKTTKVKIVFELMLNGCLRDFLLSRRNCYLDATKRNSPEADDVSSRRLTSMALDIVRALSYLSKMKFVHRDVALRNCLLNSAKSVKLGDFGMTRPLAEQTKQYALQHRRDALPIRWLAPESVTSSVFTTATDMWSFGIVLYEIITMGSYPFRGLLNNEVIERLKCGRVADLPPEIHPSLADLINQCWSMDPKIRPIATDVTIVLANNPVLVTACPNRFEATMEGDEEYKAHYQIPPEKSSGIGGGFSYVAGLASGLNTKCFFARCSLTSPFFRLQSNTAACPVAAGAGETSSATNAAGAKTKQQPPESVPFLQDSGTTTPSSFNHHHHHHHHHHHAHQAPSASNQSGIAASASGDAAAASSSSSYPLLQESINLEELRPYRDDNGGSRDDLKKPPLPQSSPPPLPPLVSVDECDSIARYNETATERTPVLPARRGHKLYPAAPPPPLPPLPSISATLFGQIPPRALPEDD